MRSEDILTGYIYRVHIAQIEEIAFDFAVLSVNSERTGYPKGLISNPTPKAAENGWLDGETYDLIRWDEIIEEVMVSDGLWVEEI